jgi:hypothetical protein
MQVNDNLLRGLVAHPMTHRPIRERVGYGLEAPQLGELVVCLVSRREEPSTWREEFLISFRYPWGS